MIENLSIFSCLNFRTTEELPVGPDPAGPPDPRPTRNWQILPRRGDRQGPDGHPRSLDEAVSSDR